VLGAAVAVALMAAAALPVLHADSRPLAATDLPAGSGAARAAVIAGEERGAAEGAGSATSGGGSSNRDGSLFGELPLAVGVSAAALALVLAIAFSPSVIPVALVTLLPAAAACGLCVLVFQDGHLAGAIDQRRQGALETGATASLLAAVLTISASRAVTAIHAARGERGLGLEPVLAADTSAALTVPAAVWASLIAAAATAVLVGTSLYPAREFGLAVAAGLLIDLTLLRVPLVAALARWGGEGH
jgi:RND superfamily putative drug exporter